MKYVQLYKKLFSKTVIVVALILSFLQPLSVFALGEQAADLTLEDQAFCDSIDEASLTFGNNGSTELSFDTQLYREAVSSRIYYINSAGEKIDLPGSEPFYSFRLNLQQKYLQDLFTLGITNAELLVDFPGRNYLHVFPDEQTFIQNESSSAKQFTNQKLIYDFTALKGLFDNNPISMFDTEGELQGGWRNDFYQIKLSYDYSQTSHELNCAIRFAVSVPPPEQYCEVSLTKDDDSEVSSMQSTSGALEYVFPVNNVDVYTLTFSDIDINSLTADGNNGLFLNSGSENLLRMSCGIKGHIKTECSTFVFQFGPGHHQFVPTSEGNEYLLTFTDTAGLPKCRNVRIIAGLDDGESKYQSSPTGTPSRDLSESDLETYTNLGNKQSQTAIANTVELCETVPPDADCGGGRGSCVQKCLSCTSHFTASDQSTYDQLLALQGDNQLNATQQMQLETLQQKSKGLSSTHIWTGLGCFPTDITGLISTIFTVLVGILGGFILLCIIVEGMRIMTSAGNPEAMKKAQEGITSCIIGFIVVFFSVLILRIIGVDILQLPWFGK